MVDLVQEQDKHLLAKDPVHQQNGPITLEIAPGRQQPAHHVAIDQELATIPIALAPEPPPTY